MLQGHTFSALFNIVFYFKTMVKSKVTGKIPRTKKVNKWAYYTLKIDWQIFIMRAVCDVFYLFLQT